jgi:paraquat-inducible protein B
MSSKASPTAVGAFVIGAMILFVSGIMLFSSGKFFTQSHTVMAVFSGNVQGLNVGAAVVMSGVRIGRVKDIAVVLDTATNAITIPVYIEIDRDAVKDVNLKKMTMSVTDNEWNQEVEALIQGGLRAQLKLQSLVTGQMIIDFDFHPDTPIVLSHISEDIIEIPTIATITDKLINKFEKIPVQAIADKLLATLEGINRLVRSKEVEDSVNNANLALVQFRQTLNTMETSVKTTLVDVSRLTRNLDTRVEPLADSAIATLNEAKSALSSLDNLVGKDSATRVDLDVALKELSKTARSLRILADYLEQHPESLLKGKGY